MHKLTLAKTTWFSWTKDIGHSYLCIYYNMNKSYCITVRPLGGLTPDTELAIVKWLKMQPHHFSCAEKTDEARHLHAQIWFEEPRARGDVCKAIQRICERTIPDWNEAQKKVLRYGVKIAYSDWYLDYLSDNEAKTGTELGIILTDSPPEITLGYYPTEEEQQLLKDTANAVDKQLFKYEQQFLLWAETIAPPYSKAQIATWLCNQMFVSRTIMVVRDPRLRKNLCISLHAYVNKSTDPALFLGDKWFVE